MGALTSRQRGLWRALEIQRFEDPKRWRELVDAIEDAEERAAAEQYLRDIVTRMRVVARIARENPRR